MSWNFDPRYCNAPTPTMPVVDRHDDLAPPRVKLSSSPQRTFKAPTAEDFDKGAQAITEEAVSRPKRSLLPTIWSRLSRL